MEKINRFTINELTTTQIMNRFTSLTEKLNDIEIQLL